MTTTNNCKSVAKCIKLTKTHLKRDTVIIRPLLDTHQHPLERIEQLGMRLEKEPNYAKFIFFREFGTHYFRLK